MVGSEVYSAEVKKTEVLMENFRRAIGILSSFVYYFLEIICLYNLSLIIIALWNRRLSIDYRMIYYMIYEMWFNYKPES